MPKLKIDTRTSLYEPIEVEIDGEKLFVRPVTLGAIEEIQELHQKLAEGSVKAIRQALTALVEGKVEILKSLPLSRLTELVEFIVEKSLKPGELEKNEQGPGAERLQ